MYVHANKHDGTNIIYVLIYEMSGPLTHSFYRHSGLVKFYGEQIFMTLDQLLIYVFSY